MDLIKIFRGLIILLVGLTSLYVLVPSSGIVDDTEWSTLLIVIAGLLVVVMVVSYVLLFLLKPLGKSLFVIYVVLGTILLLAVPDSPVPPTSLEDTISGLLSMIEGAILAMLFFSPLKETFRRKQE